MSHSAIPMKDIYETEPEEKFVRLPQENIQKSINAKLIWPDPITTIWGGDIEKNCRRGGTMQEVSCYAFKLIN